MKKRQTHCKNKICNLNGLKNQKKKKKYKLNQLFPLLKNDWQNLNQFSCFFTQFVELFFSIYRLIYIFLN